MHNGRGRRGRDQQGCKDGISEQRGVETMARKELRQCSMGASPREHNSDQQNCKGRIPEELCRRGHMKHIGPPESWGQ